MNKFSIVTVEKLPSQSKTIAGKVKVNPSQCTICGGPAIYNNFGVISCFSCKMFFKRNAEISQNKFQCHSNGHCEINSKKRRLCTYCRLKKCFFIGMKIEYIRCSRSKTNSRKQAKNQQPKQFLKSMTMENDKHVLSADQSRLLSNLLLIYDETKLLSIAQHLIDDDIFQIAEIINRTLMDELFQEVYQRSEAYVRFNEDFYNLLFSDRSAFLRNTVENITCLGLSMIFSQSHMSNYQSFMNTFDNFYRKDSSTIIQHMTKFSDSDMTLMKLTLSIFAFSINSSMISPNMSIELTNSHSISSIQNRYIEVTWKYLLNKYGQYQAVIRFDNLIQCLMIATVNISNSQSNPSHRNCIDSVTERIELSLLVDDINRMD